MTPSLRREGVSPAIRERAVSDLGRSLVQILFKRKKVFVELKGSGSHCLYYPGIDVDNVIQSPGSKVNKP